MNRCAAAFLLALTCPASSLAAEPAAAAADEAELRRLTQELFDAVAPGHREVWQRLLDGAMVYVDENGRVLDKEALIAELEPLPPGLVGSIALDRYRVALHGDTAIAAGEIQESLDYHGQHLGTRFRFLSTWLRTPDGWRLAGQETEAVLEDPPAVTLDRDVLCSYEGSYELTPAITTIVRCGENSLTSERTGRPAATYLPEVRDVFFAAGQPRVRRIFTRRADGRVDGFRDRREGEDIRWRRTGPAPAADGATPAPRVEEAIKALDTEYQSAVERRDLETMSRILADDFILVAGTGRVSTKSDVLAQVADPALVFDRQESSEQTVRVWGDTAVITALLTAEGTRAGTPFDYLLWFSDTYVRTPGGWRYVLGQAAQPLAP